jgi:hypothetical protein
MAFARELIFHGANVGQSSAPLGCLFDKPFSTTRRANSEIPFISHKKFNGANRQTLQACSCF